MKMRDCEFEQINSPYNPQFAELLRQNNNFFLRSGVEQQIYRAAKFGPTLPTQTKRIKHELHNQSFFICLVLVFRDVAFNGGRPVDRNPAQGR